MKLLKRFCRWVCQDEIWNAEMSREIDRLVAENDALRDQVRKLGGAA
jgi:hypothetical protein